MGLVGFLHHKKKKKKKKGRDGFSLLWGVFVVPSIDEEWGRRCAGRCSLSYAADCKQRMQ